MKTMPVPSLSAPPLDALLQTDSLLVVDFWAPWCGPCKAMAPVLESLADRFTGRATFAGVNIEDEPELAARFAIQAVPTLLFFRQGRLVERMVGAHASAVLERTIQSHLP